MIIRFLPLLVGFLLIYGSRSLLSDRHGNALRKWQIAATVVDLHCDAIQHYLGQADFSKEHLSWAVDLPRLIKGGVDLQVMACLSPVPMTAAERVRAAENVEEQIHAFWRLIENFPDQLHAVCDYQDFKEAQSQGKIGLMLAIEGGYVLESNVENVERFYQQGVRILTLTHWRGTGWADASGDPRPLCHGLSPLGEQIVKEMNRLGMFIDISHVHDSTFWDVLRVSNQPVIASHSCCRAINPVSRNLSDEMIRALADKGGVIGITFEPAYLSAGYRKERDRLRKSLIEKYHLPSRRSLWKNFDPHLINEYHVEMVRQCRQLLVKYGIDVSLVVDHIDHVVNICGNADHVAIGSDFDGFSIAPLGLHDASSLPEITRELFRRGYAEEDVKKILGGNFIRLLRTLNTRD